MQNRTQRCTQLKTERSSSHAMCWLAATKLQRIHVSVLDTGLTTEPTLVMGVCAGHPYDLGTKERLTASRSVAVRKWQQQSKFIQHRRISHTNTHTNSRNKEKQKNSGEGQPTDTRPPATNMAPYVPYRTPRLCFTSQAATASAAAAS